MYDTKFTSHENTNLIWDLLNEHTTEKFSYNLKSNNNKLINKFFIDTINEIRQNQTQHANVMEMNKVALLKCINFIDKNIQLISSTQLIFLLEKISLFPDRKKSIFSKLSIVGYLKVIPIFFC